MVDFIGIGAQRCGTSWIYGCLYEHPEICAPMKEIHFFSRPRYEKGLPWYESHFKKCSPDQKIGEFSTSYLYTEGTAKKIQDAYPDTKLIAVIRNPIDRAVSQYWNAVKAGEVQKSVTVDDYLKQEKSALEQGFYARQLKEYFDVFEKNQILVLVYDDAKTDPEGYIKKIYTFLGVDADFKPSMLHDNINVSRVPHSVGVEKNMHVFAEWMRKIGLDKVVHIVRKSGLPDLVRRFNTKEERKNQKSEMDESALTQYFREDVAELSKLIERDLASLWHIR